MTLDDLKALARKYSEEIRRSEEAWSSSPKEIEALERGYLLDSSGPNRSEYFLEHGRWMCEGIQGQDDRDKLNRWLGFVQCILIYERIFKLDDVRDHVRQAK